MARSAFAKNVIRSITGSLGRFLAIMGIVALGCGFYAGLQMCGPDMRAAADKLYDGTNLYDIRLVSSMGFTQKDVERVSAVEGVQDTMSAISCDAMVRIGNEQIAARMSSMDVNAASQGDERDANVILSDDGTYMNRMFLREGRWPSRYDECVISADKDVGSATVGDTIQVLYGVTDLDDALRTRDFTVVGTVSAPNYPYTGSFGSTTLGSGAIGDYVYVRQDAFKEDFPFTEIYLRVAGAETYESGSDKYKAAVNEVKSRLEAMEESLAQARLKDMKEDAQRKLDESHEEYDTKKAEAQVELDDAKAKLDDAKAELDEGRAEIERGSKELADGEKAYNDGLAELDSSRAQLNDSLQLLESSAAQIADGRAELEEGEAQWQAGVATLLSKLGLNPSMSLADAKHYVLAQKEEMARGIEQLEAGIVQAEEGMAQAQEGIAQLETLIAGIDAVLPLMPKGPLKKALEAQRADLVEQLEQAHAGLATAETTKAQLEEQLAALPSDEAIDEAIAGIEQLEESRATLDASALRLAEGEAQLREGQAAYEAGVEQFNDGVAQLEKSSVEIEEGRRKLDDGRKELDDGQAEYEQGLADYEEAKAEADQKFADARAELEDAQKEIDELEAPELYLLDRTQNEGIVAHNSDSHRMDSIADVFPFIFFLVAALVSLTTMTRMVDDCRIEIGTYKALGYSKTRIASKFLWYAGAASVVGAIVGIALLSQVLPIIVTSSYSIIYTVPVQLVFLPIHPGIALMAGGLGVGVTLLATYVAVVASLRESPANLMLPRAPSAGKRILLERIGFIWKHLSFSWKVTCRNMFRYKKRLAMTIIGISGCTALMLVGFGLHDSIWDVIDGQYGPIQHYDTVVGLNSDANELDVSEVVDYLESTGEVHDVMRVQQENMQAGSDQSDVSPISVSVVIPQRIDEFQKAITLRDRLSHEPVAFDDDAVVVTEKLAARYGIQVGDEILIFEQDNMGNAKGEGMPLVVTGIAENYVFHHVYVGKNAWQAIDAKQPVYSTILCTTSPDAEVRKTISDTLHDFDNVSIVSFTDETIQKYRNMLSVVDLIVVVLIVSAGLLAFIVLYNLTNINIGERVREIASLKVLGFTKREVYAYIFREIALLAIMGDALGMVLGIFLEYFVVTTAEVDQVMFGRTIHAPSFVYAFALTLLFTVLILLAMRHKLDKVNMVESLKSVE